VRQKARWTLGIVFHGWQQRGWEGNLPLRYMIWRDRKALLTNAVNILGYLLLLEAAVGPRWATGSGPGGTHLPFIPADGWVWKVILVDALLLFNRCVQRVACDVRVSSWKQAALSLPRIIWGNVINFCAVARATHIFIRNRLTGEKLVWAKTAHAFPTEAQLLGYKRKLGDLLLEQRRITLAHLSSALQAQKGTGKRLGDILVDSGWADEAAIVEALAGQLKVEWRRLDYERLRREDLDLITECACREHLMVVADGAANPVVVAAAVVGDERMKGWLDANFPYPYRLVLAGRRNIVSVIDRVNEARAREGLPVHVHPHGAAAPRAESPLGMN
jgi:adsorption protein B